MLLCRPLLASIDWPSQLARPMMRSNSPPSPRCTPPHARHLTGWFLHRMWARPLKAGFVQIIFSVLGMPQENWQAQCVRLAACGYLFPEIQPHTILIYRLADRQIVWATRVMACPDMTGYISINVGKSARFSRLTTTAHRQSAGHAASGQMPFHSHINQPGILASCDVYLHPLFRPEKQHV